MLIKPNFFIVGTPKSGTTSLFNYLDEHPEIFIPKIKEPHFFSTPEIKQTYYKTTIIENQNEYLDLFNKVSTERAVGDLSTSYLKNPKSAERIKKFNSESKIIIVLRNPVERAISHYLMDKNLGYISSSLSEIIQNHEKHYKFYEQYVELGFYSKQINIYQKEFKKQNILFLLSDDLFKNQEETLFKIFKFLEVDDSFRPEKHKTFNKYSEPKYDFVKKIKNSRSFIKTFNLLPETLKNKIKGKLLKTDIEKPKFEKEKFFLKKLYQEDIEKTAEATSLDLKTWQ